MKGRVDIQSTGSEKKIQEILKRVNSLFSRLKEKATVSINTKPAEAAAGRLSGAVTKVNAKLAGIGQFVPSIGALQGALAGATGSGLKAAAAFAGIGLAAVGLFKAIQIGKEFDDKLNQSVAIMGNVSDAMRNDMADAAKQVALDTNLAASAAAESYFFLASAGLNAQQSIAALPQVALFAKAGMFDMAKATDLATDAQSALGLSSKDAEENLVNLTRVTDVFVKANTLANTSVEQISTAITNKAGTALNILGKDIEEGAAALLVFADKGVKAEKAGEQFAIALRDMQTAALKNTSAFEKFNVSVFDEQGEMRNVADIIFDLETAMGGMSDAAKKATLAQLGFKDKSQAALLTLVGSSSKIREYEAGLRDAGGVTKEIAEKQMLSFSERLKQVTGFLENFALTAFEAIGPVLTLFVDLATGILSVLKPVVSLVGQFAPLIAGAAGIVLLFAKWHVITGAMATAGLKLVGLLTVKVPLMVQSAVATVRDTAAKVANKVASIALAVSTVGLTGALRILWLTMLANPIGLVIGAVGLLVGAFALFGSSGETVEEALEGVGKASADAQKTIADTKASDDAADANLKLADSYDKLKGSSDPGEMREFQRVTDSLAASVPEAVVATDGMGQSLGDLAGIMVGATEQAEINTDVVRAMAEEQKRLNAEARDGAMETLAEETRDLVEATAEASEEVQELRDRKASLQERIAQLREEGSPYAEYQIARLNGELKETTQELGEQAGEVQRGKEGIRDQVKLFQEQGKTIEEIGEELGITADETRGYVLQLEAAEREAERAKIQASGLTEETYRNVEATAGLAAQWNTVTKSINNALNQSIQALAQFRRAQIAAGDAGTKFGQTTSTLLSGFGFKGTSTQLDNLFNKTETNNARTLAQEKKLNDEILKQVKLEVEGGKVATSSSRKKQANKIKEIDLYGDIVDLIKEQRDLEAESAIATKEDRLEILEAEHQERLRQIKVAAEAERRQVRADIAERLKLDTEAAQKYIESGEGVSEEKYKKLSAEERAQVDRFYEELNKLVILQEKESARERADARRDALLEMFDEERDLYTQAAELNAEAERAVREIQREALDLSTTSGVIIDRDLQVEELQNTFDDAAREIARSSPEYIAAMERLRDAVGAGLIPAEDAVAEEQRIISGIVLDETDRAGSLINLRWQKFLREREELFRESSDRVIEIEAAAGRNQNALFAAFLKFREGLFQSYTDRIKAIREEDNEDEKEKADEQIIALRKRLADGLIGRAEFSRELSSISEQIGGTTEKVGEFWDTVLEDFNAGAAKGFELAGESFQGIVDEANHNINALFTLTAEELEGFSDEKLKELGIKTKNTWEAIGQAGLASLGQLGTAMAQFAVQGENILKNTALFALDIAATYLDKIALQVSALIWGREVSSLGFAGIATATALTATFMGLVSLAKTALTGGFRDGGNTGRGPINGIAGVVHFGEEVVKYEHSKNHRPFYQSIHKGLHPVAAAFKHYPAHDLLRLGLVPKMERSRSGVAVDAGLLREVRSLRADVQAGAARTEAAVENLKGEIEINRAIAVSGTLEMDTRKATAAIKRADYLKSRGL